MVDPADDTSSSLASDDSTVDVEAGPAEQTTAQAFAALLETLDQSRDLFDYIRKHSPDNVGAVLQPVRAIAACCAALIAADDAEFLAMLENASRPATD